MTLRFDIKPDEAALEEAKALFKFVGGNSRQAKRVAINRTGRNVQSLSNSKIRERANLRVAFINRKLEFRRATNVRLVGRIKVESRGLLTSRYSTDPLISGDKFRWIYPPPVPPRGIRVKIKPKGGTKLFSGGNEIVGQPFYMVLRGSKKKGPGPVAIVGRRKTPGPKGGKIKVFFSPSVSQLFNSVRKQVLPEAANIYTQEMIRAMRFLLTKRYPTE